MTVHMIWLGSELPEKYRANIATYEKHYDVVLHTEPIDMVNIDLFNRARSWALKADIMRLELIMQYGGMYTDVDSYLIAPVPIDSDLVCMTSSSGYIANETIYATKGHPAIVEAVESMAQHVASLKGDVNIWEIAGATYITPILSKYPHIKHPHSLIARSRQKPSCIAHTYDASWLESGGKSTKQPLTYWLDA
jgi:mannosyltransferase OCH1-like enzyme